ncbi:uncharacterized protein LAESUDRAFT_751260 [Laetiporus sulphureus 93-53]|uniref:Uncharacterized protein n=1 Tax=Laetiporus sulphureus 93-53 TaxID=1314785 RepID=A0A165D593_9APHY|nr:uncharacterized protein LAESUDRAFT_751260 [Laetiporus sulphureus 93-53]KZT04178.1 hypothetical protein LAESUDRAFT_751260 [Laetiporus sulphureus 93-53]
MFSLLKRAHAAIKKSIKRLKKLRHTFVEHNHVKGPTGAIFEAITASTITYTDDDRDDILSICFTVDGFEEHALATEGDDGCTDASDEYESTFHMRFGARVLQPIPEIGAGNFPEPVLYLDGWNNTAEYEDEHVLAEQGCFESEDINNGNELEMIRRVETSGTESDESSFLPTPPSLSFNTAPTQQIRRSVVGQTTVEVPQHVTSARLPSIASCERVFARCLDIGAAYTARVAKADKVQHDMELTEARRLANPQAIAEVAEEAGPTQPNTIWHIATELVAAAGVTEAETEHISAWSALSDIPDYVDKTMAWDIFLGEIFYKLKPSHELKPGMALAAMRAFNKRYPENRFTLVETPVAAPKDRERSNVVDGQKRKTEVPTNHSRGVSSAEGGQRMNASMDEPRKQAVKESRVLGKEHRAHDEEFEKRWAAEYCSTIYLQAWMHLAGMTLVLRDIKQKQRQHARQKRERRLCGGGGI